jgi:HSP20 family protein
VENQDGYVIQARVPGVAKKDIQVDIQGRYLKIVVQPAQEQPAADGNRVVLSEFDTVGRAERVLQFREGLDADSASLALADGVLTIRVASPVQRNRRTLTLSD